MPAITDLDDSEASFLEAMRDNDTDFTLTVSRQGGHWIIAMRVPSVDVDENPGVGEGRTFSEAWSDLKPHWHDFPVGQH